jgi:hypothetical protein
MEVNNNAYSVRGTKWQSLSRIKNAKMSRCGRFGRFFCFSNARQFLLISGSFVTLFVTPVRVQKLVFHVQSLQPLTLDHFRLNQ